MSAIKELAAVGAGYLGHGFILNRLTRMHLPTKCRLGAVERRGIVVSYDLIVGEFTGDLPVEGRVIVGSRLFARNRRR